MNRIRLGKEVTRRMMMREKSEKERRGEKKEEEEKTRLDESEREREEKRTKEIVEEHDSSTRRERTDTIETCDSLTYLWSSSILSSVVRKTCSSFLVFRSDDKLPRTYYTSVLSPLKVVRPISWDAVPILSSSTRGRLSLWSTWRENKSAAQEGRIHPHR